MKKKTKNPSTRVAVLPGSFNPLHKGHKEIIAKALSVFDKVIIAQGTNPDKTSVQANISPDQISEFGDKVEYIIFTGLLADFVKQIKADAVIRGLRNAQDLESETIQQYWNEDLGLTVPFFYVICDRTTRHISSSAIRAVNKFNKTKELL